MFSVCWCLLTKLLKTYQPTFMKLGGQVEAETNRIDFRGDLHSESDLGYFKTFFSNPGSMQIVQSNNILMRPIVG